MKNTFYFLTFLVLSSCGNSSEKLNETSIEKKSDQLHANIEKSELKKYSNVPEMLKEGGDYYEENGSYKLISKNPLHIQLAKEMFDGDLEDVINDQVRRNIVYVGFRTFAQTDANSIRITSLPLRWDLKNKKPLGYENRYKEEVMITRKKAEALLEKHYGYSDFKKLFGEQTGEFYNAEGPSKDFKKMLYNDQGEPTLNKVFNELK